MKSASIWSLAWLAVVKAAGPFQCSICPEGTRPSMPFTVVFIDGEAMTCREAFLKGDMAVERLEDCTFIQNLGKFSCLCSADAPPIKEGCKLCQDGSNLPKPNYEPWPTRSCREMQADATINDVCPLYQTSLGQYCGCKDNVARPSTCRLCGNTKLLPDPGKRTSQGISCLEREFVGTISGTCSAAREKYAGKCCEGAVPFPTRIPTLKNPTRTPTRKPSVIKPSRTPTRKPSVIKPSRTPTKKPSVIKSSRTPTRKPFVIKSSRTPTRKPAQNSSTREPSRKQSFKPFSNPPGVDTYPCFSGDMLLTEVGGTSVAMKDLKVGTYIKDGEGSFSRVYSFGHHDSSAKARYLQIFTQGNSQPLEISVEHMVYSNQSKEPIAAGFLEIGNSLRVGNGALSLITNIKTVARTGAYAPFTDSGVLVVNGILASSYIVMDHGVPISQQWLAHLFQSPHRMCTRMGACAESYDEDGLSLYVSALYKSTSWWMVQNLIIRVVLFVPAFLIYLIIYAFEMMMMSAYAVSVLAMMISWVWFHNFVDRGIIKA